MKTNTISISINGISRLFQYREDSGGHGDQGAIEQIFNRQDYNIFGWHQGQRLLRYHLEKSKKQPSLIVDAGANIGASVVFFSLMFRNSLVFAVEPDSANWHLLNRNTAGLNVYNFHGAIADRDGEMEIIDPAPGYDMDFRTRPIADVNLPPKKIVKSISPESIFTHPATKNTAPLILKIDIEGGEEALFQGCTDWLETIPLVIIELHDWMLPFAGSSRNFVRSIAKFEFDILCHGENFFLFNRKLLNDR